MRPTDLTWERKKRTDDNSDLSPADLLRLALEDLEKGDYPSATRCAILIIQEPADKSEPATMSYYRSNMTRVEEVGYLAVWQQNRIHAMEC